MAEKQEKLQEEDAYASGKRNKVGDFFIGFGLFWGLYIIFSLFVYAFSFLSLKIIDSQTFILGNFFPILISGLLTILSSILAYLIFFRGRRLVMMGMITALVLPLLFVAVLLGACLIIINGM